MNSIKSVRDFNDYIGVNTLHPLVTVINMSNCKPMKLEYSLLNMYAIFLKSVNCGPLRYGNNYYDYKDGTILTVAPGQVFGVETQTEIQPHGWALLFHPDLIYGTELGRIIKEYTFFSYDSNEALHLSEKERNIIENCFENISTELERNIDNYTNTVVVRCITLLLDYCMRFYSRQFITRHKVNSDILSRLERIVDDYFLNGTSFEKGLLSVAYCADKLCLSPNYFGDLIKKELGKSPKEYIQDRLLAIAKEKLLGSNDTINEISESLGFKYPAHFTRLFKNCVGLTPQEYRTIN
ncbi:MAG: helix-turn-helix transcriptional regulator [Bacteroidales bacterium]|nr:helix-turn-helix transcriptional regulator [Bacteroidales bacterium]